MRPSIYRSRRYWNIRGSSSESTHSKLVASVGACSDILVIDSTLSATDTVTYALTPNVTISGNFTASGSGTHTLGQISFASSTIASSGSTVTVDDDLSLSAGKTLTADNISSSIGYVDFGAKHVVTSGYLYSSAAPGSPVIVFEGSNQNDFETLITVVEPTADRTITVPNETGTMITTGSSGVVTGSIIAADTVAEANMADDAIGQDQLKSVVTLQILNSSGTVVKTMYGAGA